MFTWKPQPSETTWNIALAMTSRKPQRARVCLWIPTISLVDYETLFTIFDFVLLWVLPRYVTLTESLEVGKNSDTSPLQDF
jgi:hypothetical protein